MRKNPVSLYTAGKSDGSRKVLESKKAFIGRIKV